MSKITAVILAKNEESMIEDCLKSVDFCDEIVLIDSGSTDQTLSIAKKYDAKIGEDRSSDFAKKRELGLTKAKNPWILYVDADERVSNELKKEILAVTSSEENASAYEIQRRNYYLGKNEWPQVEHILRLFKKDDLLGWKGALHESPVIKGQVERLDSYLDHYTHRDLSSMLSKTIQWSDVEAKLRYKNNHPHMTWWRFLRVMLQAFYNSYITQSGWKAGTVGVIESLYQAFSMFVTYAKLWELQQKKDL